MTENSLVTRRVFTKLFLAFVVVLFLGLVGLDFCLRQVIERSIAAQAEESLATKAHLLAAHITQTSPVDPNALDEIARVDAAAAGADVTFFDTRGELLAGSRA